MSDNEEVEVETVYVDHEQPAAARAFSASPVGFIALILGVVLAVVFLFRFNGLIHDIANHDLKAAIQALQITVVAVWIGVALWGGYLVKDGWERASTHRRLNAQDLALYRIEHALAEMDKEKESVSQKSRSFWDWRRGETS